MVIVYSKYSVLRIEILLFHDENLKKIDLFKIFASIMIFFCLKEIPIFERSWKFWKISRQIRLWIEERNTESGNIKRIRNTDLDVTNWYED